MANISVIILTKNSGATIEKAITSSFLISDDVWVVDSGSEDQTLTLASKLKAKILHISWQGYGAARNTGAKEAKYDTVLCLDSDEEITPPLADAINKLGPAAQFVYGFKRVNFLGNKKIRYGEWGSDWVYRLYNRDATSWNNDAVHETLDFQYLERKKISGELNHYTAPDLDSYQLKLKHYSVLAGKKMAAQGKAPGFFKRSFSPVFSFLKNYFFKLGFLEGKEGWQIAVAVFKYTRDKYRYFKTQADTSPL